MKKETGIKKTVSKPTHSNKKEMVTFLYKTKAEARKNRISYDMRLENYTNPNKINYTYGIR